MGSLNQDLQDFRIYRIDFKFRPSEIVSTFDVSHLASRVSHLASRIACNPFDIRHLQHYICIYIMSAVTFKNISKRFGDCISNEDISFEIKRNTVHCILGENGAGKSTLMKILFGIYQPDEGEILLNGDPVVFESPHDAIEKKIGMVHQHFMLIDDFTVLENVILGMEQIKGIKLDIAGSKRKLTELIDRYNLGLDPDAKISELSISQQQKVEILKLLFRDSDILIFDEPTAVLSPVEVNEFFKIISSFKESGKTILLITHKLNEVKEISDKVSVLRKGRLVYEEINNDDLKIDELSSAIIGDSVRAQRCKKEDTRNIRKNIMELKNISLERYGVKVLNKLDLELTTGEIHGICGVEGNGQNEITDIITGLEDLFQGSRQTWTDKISLVPDDRIKKGMISEFSIGENIILKSRGYNFIREKQLGDISKSVIKDFDVRVPAVDAELGSLSGGNQQKVIVAREIDLNNDIIIFSHPSRGVDINATLFIHSKIIEQRNKGKAILLISSDLEELLYLSDRLSVLYNGTIVRSFGPDEINSPAEEDALSLINDTQSSSLQTKLGKLMIGLKD